MHKTMHMFPYDVPVVLQDTGGNRKERAHRASHTTGPTYLSLGISESLDDKRRYSPLLSVVGMPIYSRMQNPVSCSNQGNQSTMIEIKRRQPSHV